MLELSTFYGVVYYDEETDQEYYPVYPFAPSRLDKKHLKEFVATYYDELEACYKQNVYASFLFQKCKFETEAKEKLKKEWHKKGVIIN
ncbi:hypothetical protein [Streptococcus cuniculi]|uniref:Uncharacterized protein n=1 Tax=Streptococcus cuniculi TaxID=1432788 RepID=A0A4Y9JAW5_9STRE|nr:hypothetical protein [Streptococcus cuniculi]MBF0777862.1 hypothetical protein [Streptococcus cuniculi]TFU98160.1 hypothetical protein E4T82_03885 [Streptococcus cuniculi]